MTKDSQVNKNLTTEDIPDSEPHADTRALAELIGLATSLNSSRSIDNLLDKFSRGLSEVWPDAGVRLCEIDRTAGCLIPLESLSAEPIPIRGSMLGIVAMDSECMVIENIDENPTYMRGREAPPGVRWHSAIACPIPLSTEASHVVAVFIPDKTSVGNEDRILLKRAVMLLEPLIKRWHSQAIQLKAFSSIARAIAGAVDARDPHLVGHGERVSEFAQAIASVHGLTNGFIERLGLAGLLHDIGRLGIPEKILMKPGPLTPEEFRVIRAHPALSVSFLEKVDYLSDVFSAIRHHHERYDGAGYPDGVEGEDIPLGARILAVSDAFDAMTSPRPFRDALTDGEALDELRSGMGSQFDPIIVEAFFRAFEDKLIISQNVLRADDPLADLRSYNRV